MHAEQLQQHPTDALEHRVPTTSKERAPTGTEGGAKAPARTWLGMSIDTIMKRDPVTVHVRDTVRNVQAIMNRTGTGHIPVLDDGRPVGVVTARDVARSLPVPLTMLDRQEIERLLSLPVGMIMSTPVTTLFPSATVGMAVALMVEERVGAVVVTNPEDGRLLGLATRSAILALLAEFGG